MDARLIPGDEGVFDVVVDTETLFSKHSTERFPEPGEVTGIIRKKKEK